MAQFIVTPIVYLCRKTIQLSFIYYGITLCCWLTCTCLLKISTSKNTILKTLDWSEVALLVYVFSGTNTCCPPTYMAGKHKNIKYCELLKLLSNKGISGWFTGESVPFVKDLVAAKNDCDLYVKFKNRRNSPRSGRPVEFIVGRKCL